MMGVFQTELRYERKYFWAFIWGLVLAADLICVSFFLAGERNMRRYIENDYNADLVRDFAQIQKDADLGVVMLGNSRLRHATRQGVDPQKLVTLPDGRVMAALQFAYNAGRFDLYDDFSWQILQAEPDLIIIQDSIISNAPGGGAEKWLIQVSGIVMQFYQKLWQKQDEHAEWLRDRNLLLGRCDFTFDDHHMAQRIAFMEKDHHSLSDDNPGYVMARRFLQKARAMEIPVVVLNIPPRMDLLEQFGVTPDFVDFHGLGFYPQPEQLLPRLHDKISWASYKADDALYCDEMHLSPEGRTDFTRWINHEIPEWLDRGRAL